VRIVRTTLAGWKRYKNHPDLRIRRRYAWEARELGTSFSALLGAARRFYRDNPTMRAKMDAILRDLRQEFGWKSALSAAVGGRYVSWTLRREQRRLARGWTYEPPTFYENNEAAAQLAAQTGASASGLSAPSVSLPVTCRVEPPRPARPAATKRPAAVPVA